MSMLSPSCRPSFLLLLLAAATTLRAQCTTQWLQGQGVPGTTSAVYATITWDPDGAGPSQPVLVVGGGFTMAGDVAATHIATWDPATANWSALGTGIVGNVYALAVMANGDLVAGGNFNSVGNVVRWNGATWSPMGSGVSGIVRALAVMWNGDLIAGGDFLPSCVARWDGTSWIPVGYGGAPGMNGPVHALATTPTGLLYAGGEFTTADGASANHVARWNGAYWTAMGVGATNGMDDTVRCLVTHPSGQVFAGGDFLTATSILVNHIARWNGGVWQSLAGGTDGAVDALALTSTGIVAGGAFTTAGGSVSANRIAACDGTSWSSLGSGANGSVYTVVTLSNGDIVAGGYFRTTGALLANYIARWNGAAWSAMGSGTNDAVSALQAMPNGDLVAAGSFTMIEGAQANRIARWNGSAWAPLGTGTNNAVYALATLPNGDLVAGGGFSTAGGAQASRIARWVGTWTALGSGLNDTVYALATLPNGDLVAGGRFTIAGGTAASCIARWNGATWSPMGSGMTGSASGLGTTVRALVILPNGDFVAGGDFTAAGGVAASCLARWNGTTWSPLGSGVGGTSPYGLRVGALTPLPNGDLVAGGTFTTIDGVAANRIARWNGTTWSPLGSGIGLYWVGALTTLPNGSLGVGGSFGWAGGVSANCVASWDGTAWSALGSGMQNSVEALTTLPNGTLVAGGYFTTAGGRTSAYIARYTTTCPASAVSYGAGCPSSGGSNTLTATSLPWVGTTFRATGTGLPGLAFALAATGVQPVVPPLPLASVFLEGVPGCNLLVTPDIVEAMLASGTAQSQLFLPNTPGLIGATFYHQMVLIQITPQAAFVAITATNALRLTAGVF